MHGGLGCEQPAGRLREAWRGSKAAMPARLYATPTACASWHQSWCWHACTQRCALLGAMQGARSVQDITTLSKDLRAQLAERVRWLSGML